MLDVVSPSSIAYKVTSVVRKLISSTQCSAVQVLVILSLASDGFQIINAHAAEMLPRPSPGKGACLSHLSHPQGGRSHKSHPRGQNTAEMLQLRGYKGSLAALQSGYRWK